MFLSCQGSEGLNTGWDTCVAICRKSGPRSRSQDFRLEEQAPGSCKVPPPTSITRWLWPTIFQKSPNCKNKNFASLRGPVSGLKGPITGLKGTILSPKGHIPGLKGPILGLSRPISGLKRTDPGLGSILGSFQTDRPISGLRRYFASLRRSKLGLRSNLVHSSLRRVTPSPERIDFKSENWSAPLSGKRKAFSCPRN